MDFEFDGVLEALAGDNSALSEFKIEEKKLYPLYRNYPNGSKQYYARLREEENQSEEEFPDVKLGILGYLDVDIKKIKSECVKDFERVKSECAKEFKSMFKSFTKNPYF